MSFLKKLKPIFIENSKIPVWLSKISPISIGAISFFIFVFSRGEMSKKTKRHETIHFQQQIELLFIFQWLLYGIFWLIGLIKSRSGAQAYFSNPFELEAYANEFKENYLINRRRYSWIKYCCNKKD